MIDELTYKNEQEAKYLKSGKKPGRDTFTKGGKVVYAR
jgi:hypothetical protein